MWWTKGWRCFCALLVAAPLAAQERVEELDLPRHVAEDVIAFFNAPSTVRFQGRADVPGGRSIVGDVAVLGGPVLVEGEIEGDLVVVNGTLTVRDGGRITGDVTVLGGRADLDASAVGGQLTVYDEPLTYQRRGDRIAYDDSPWTRWGERRRQGRSYFSVRAAGNYNRVEGLPVLFGPVFRTMGDDYFRLDALGLWRSESGIRIAPRELGYVLKAEQRFGPEGRFSVGAEAHSLVDPIERNGLQDVEASLAAFLLHRDYRDYFEREGFAGRLGYHDVDAGVRLGLEYRDDEHAFVMEGSPWTIKRNDAPWRPQPLVAEGRLRSLAGEIVLDNRNDRENPTDGWYVEAGATLGISGDLAMPEYRAAEPSPATIAAPERSLEADFGSGLLDVRRYLRLGPGADLRLRGYLAGSLDGEPLPPQFQRTLGGEGTLPGFSVMQLDCGARTRPFSVFRSDEETTLRLPVFAGYGCDRVALFQAEYRSALSFDLGFDPNDEWDETWNWYPSVEFEPSWSVFFDAGRGWSLADPTDPAFLGPDSATLMDVGFGIHLGELGLYWAWPLSGGNKDVNFFLRIDHRF